jgi:hypothetical protein
MSRGDVQPQQLDQTREARCLALRKVEHQARECGGVDDRVLQRALEAAADEPGVERVVAVLHQHGALGKAQEGPAGVSKLGRSDEHGAIDVMAPARIRVDGRPAVDERVEKRERAIQPESFGSDFQDQERRVAGRFDVERHELRLVEPGRRADLRRIDRDLLPRHRPVRATRLQEQCPGFHLVSVIARLAHENSSPLTARRSTTAAA